MAILAALLLSTFHLVLASRLECIIEDGFDYVGNDLFSLHAMNAFECCHHCQESAKAGCRAYSWTADGGGTCWLKSGRGTIAVNSNVKSGTIAAFRFTETCALEHGIDYVGFDMGSVKSSDAGACCSVCDQMPGCRAFTFTPHNGGMCWLKSARGGMTINSEAVSAQIYVEEPTCGLEHDVEYVGNDIGSVRSNDPQNCCSLCEAFGGCRAFTWSDHQGGTCWFKNRKDEVTWETGVKSGQVVENPAAPSCALELSVNYVGNTIATASSASAYGCCSICMSAVGCVAFSWSDLDGGTCYLKSFVGDTQASPHFMSAVV